MISEEELKQFNKNEERLWDLAALTIAPTIFQVYSHMVPLDGIANISYNLAEALMKERRKRLAEPSKAPPSEVKP